MAIVCIQETPDTGRWARPSVWRSSASGLHASVRFPAMRGARKSMGAENTNQQLIAGAASLTLRQALARSVVILPSTDPSLEPRRQLSDKPPLRDDANFASRENRHLPIRLGRHLSGAHRRVLVACGCRIRSSDERAQANGIKSAPLIARRGMYSRPRRPRDRRLAEASPQSYSSLRESLKEEHLKAHRRRARCRLRRVLMAKIMRFHSRPKYEPAPVLKEENGSGRPRLCRFAP